MKMKKMFLCVLAMAIAVTCCLSLTAFAEDSGDKAIILYSAANNTKTKVGAYNTLKEAVDAMDTTTEYIVELQKDLEENITTLVGNNWGGDAGNALNLGVKKLTITSNTGNTRTLTLKSIINEKLYMGCLQLGGGTLKFENINVTNCPDGATGSTGGLIRFTANDNVTIGEGATVTAGGATTAIKYDGDGAKTLTLSGGTLKLKKEITMGNANDTNNTYALNLTSGNIDASGCDGAAAILANKGASVNVSAGVTFTGGNYLDVISTGDTVNNDNTKLHAADGIVSGSKVYAYGDKKLAIPDTVNNVKTAKCYTDLEKAMDAATSGSTIYFLDDVEFIPSAKGTGEYAGTWTYVLKKKLTLNGLSHILKFGSKDGAGSAICCNGDDGYENTLTVKNADIMREDSVSVWPVFRFNKSNLTLDNCDVSLSGKSASDGSLLWMTGGYSKVNMKDVTIKDCKSSDMNLGDRIIRYESGVVKLTDCTVKDNRMYLIKNESGATDSINGTQGYSGTISLVNTEVSNNIVPAQSGGVIFLTGGTNLSCYVYGNTKVKNNYHRGGTASEWGTEWTMGTERNIDIANATLSDSGNLRVGTNFTGEIGVYAGEKTSFGTATAVPSVTSIKNDGSATAQFARAENGKLVWTEKPTLKFETDLGKYTESEKEIDVLRVVTTNTNEKTTPITKFGTAFVGSNGEITTIPTDHAWSKEENTAVEFGNGNGWFVDLAGEDKKSGTVYAVSFYYVSGVKDPVIESREINYDFSSAKTIDADQVASNSTSNN